MLSDCIKVFEHELKERGDRWLLDNYVPKDGTYVLINMDRDFQPEEQTDIIYDKKKGEIIGRTHKDFRFFQLLDYNSKLLEMNKPVDPKKVVHSNNVFTFFIKKESLTEKKVTGEIVDGYYDIIKNPELKYTKPKALRLYKKTEQEIGAVDTGTADRIKNWIIEWLKNPDLLADIDLSQKNYLKLFFVYDDREKTKRLYEQENRRYLIPNIYNSNDYNEEPDGITAGLPNNNMGMNSKKPYLANKSRKREVPCLATLDQALLQAKFFDFLWGQASVGKVNIYFDYDNQHISAYDSREPVTQKIDSGGYLRIKKDKNEAQIQSMDTLTGYQPELKGEFVYKDILDLKPEIMAELETGYGRKNSRSDINLLFDEVFFGKKLIYNYFNEPSDITFQDSQLENILLTYRECLFGWFYEGMDTDMQQLTDELADKLIYHSICNGYWNKVRHQINLKWSLTDYFKQNSKMEDSVKMLKENLKKHMDMYREEWDFEDDGEYFYTVGLMVSYFLSLSKAARTPLSIINSFLNAKNDKLIKEKVMQLFQKYNYAIDSKKDTRVQNLLTHILQYKTEGKVQKDMLTAGLTDKIMLYVSKEEKKGGMEHDD